MRADELSLLLILRTTDPASDAPHQGEGNGPVRIINHLELRQAIVNDGHAPLAITNIHE